MLVPNFLDDPYGVLGKVSPEMRRFLMRHPKELLFENLRMAELDARKGGKVKTFDCHIFQAHLYDNLRQLRDDLWDLVYKPSRGTAHIVNVPVKREIFAAPYRDRIVHHLIVKTINMYWEPRLSEDAYSCRKGRGTSYGIKRLKHHILSASNNLKDHVYVVKLDITGYFMHIRRDVMYEKVMHGLDQQFEGHKGKTYQILKHAIYEVIFDDPVDGVKIEGSYHDWYGLPEDKSLFCQPPGRGMVIGNFTSQDFSNIYLDEIVRFIKFDLGYKHSGQYVDDMYIVVKDEELPQLKRDIKAIENRLNGLGLALNHKKTRVIPWEQGVPFLGYVVKGHAILPDKRIMRNFRQSAYRLATSGETLESVTSYLGMMKHANGEKATKKIFDDLGWEYRGDV